MYEGVKTSGMHKCDVCGDWCWHLYSECIKCTRWAMEYAEKIGVLTVYPEPAHQ